jgi:hypothetical protein
MPVDSENIIDGGERSSGLPFWSIQESFHISMHSLSSVGAKVAHRYCDRSSSSVVKRSGRRHGDTTLSRCGPSKNGSKAETSDHM